VDGEQAARLSFDSAHSMEIKMRKQILTVLSVLLIAALTIPTATAAHKARKAARAPGAVTQQLRDALGSADSAPPAMHQKSCDVLWCYAN
jgi:hypothetical protein